MELTRQYSGTPFITLINLIGSFIPKRLVRPFIIVKMKILLQFSFTLPDILIILEINLLPFYATPEALYKDIIETTTFPIHTDLNALLGQDSSEFTTGELRALIRIENLWLANGKGFPESLYAKIHFHGNGNSPGKNKPTMPIHHSHQINKASFHADIGDIRGPHKIGTINV
jgi:hypothetical protein